MYPKNLKNLLFLPLFLIIFFAIPNTPAFAYNKVIAVFVDGVGDPITTALDLRISLWDSSKIQTGDVDGSGNIDTSAESYGSYQTTFTITPDGSGYFIPSTFGYYRFNTKSLTAFPNPIEKENAFLQLEYKAQGAANTEYLVYDFVDDPTSNDISRKRLIDTVSYAVSDAGRKTTSNMFTLDSNDDASNSIRIRFGKTIAETFKWDISNAQFELSDDLVVDGIIQTNGISFTLDSDNTGAGANVKIIAEQGTDNDGTLRYNATSNSWQINNDAAGFNDIHMANVFYAYDSTGGQAIDDTVATLNLDNQVIADSNYTLAADQVTINETGLYRVTADLTYQTTDTLGSTTATTKLKVQEDNLGLGSFSNITGAITRCLMREGRSSSCSLTFMHTFDATDIMRIRMSRMDGTTNFETTTNGSRLSIERIR